jgi:beta-lactamase regulating signal transducer with metallopeptidase domain
MNYSEFLFRQPFTMALGWALVHFLWQGAVIALLLGLANHLFRRASANLRYAFACVAMLSMLAAGITTLAWLGSSPQAGAAAPFGGFEAAPRPSGISGATALPVGTPVLKFEQWLDQHLAALVWFWLAGVTLLSLRTAGGWIVAQRLKRIRTYPAAAMWQQRLAHLSAHLNIQRLVTLRESALARTPTVIGWLRPVILLPTSALAGLTPEMMEAVLAHELAHIRRHDYLMNMLQTAVETLLFYHPAVWWVGARIRQERENCCDDLAVGACGNAITYARALTELEELRGGYPRFALAATGGSLLARVRRLLGARPPASRVPSMWLALVVAALSFAGMWTTGAVSVSYHDGNRPLIASARLTPVAQTADVASETAAAQNDEPASADEQSEQATPAAQAAPQSSGEESGDFIGGLSAAGYKNLSVDQLITFKIHGVNAEFVKQMEAAGFGHPDPDELVTMKIHGVDREFANGIKAAGFSGLSIDQLVSFKIHGVDPARLAEMQKLWGKLSADNALALQIHGVTPEYARQMEGLGLGKPSIDEILALKIHGVTPEFANALKAAGLKVEDLDRLTAFKIHGVDPARIAEIQKLGFGPLDADDVLSLQIHGVTPEFLRGFKDLGFEKLTLDEALAARIHGVSPEFVKAARKRGFNDLSMEQIIKLKQFDILSGEPK